MLSERTSERITGLAGILFVVGAVLGFGVLVGSIPGPGAEAGEVREFVARSEIRVWAGGYLGLLAELAFFFFAAGLWSILRRAEAGTGWVSTAGLAAAATAVAVIVAGELMPAAAVFWGGEGVDPSVAALLLDVNKLTGMTAVPLIGLFVGAAAVVSLRTGVLPRWAGWSAAAIGAASFLLLPLGYETSQIPAFAAALWILAVAVRLLVRPV